MAVAHSMLVAIYHVLKDGVKYEDLGAEYLILQRKSILLLRNLFILASVMFIGGIYYRYSTSTSKEIQNIAFFMKISLLVLSLILIFTGKEFISIGDLAFGGRTPVMVLVLIEIADAFIDRRNNLTQLNKKKRFTVRDGMMRYSKR